MLGPSFGKEPAGYGVRTGVQNTASHRYSILIGLRFSRSLTVFEEGRRYLCIHAFTRMERHSSQIHPDKMVRL